ncbi:MAG TPA: MBL fold metallo-hydrolase [Candidatus Bilamarchaeaceae archaeon]|nr:MBL fold metallo-hydrolase [Candidatus Bilamarchaeaceae archaeon]
MTTLHCLGASQEVGRSAFLLETDKRLLLDYGIKIFGEGGKPQYPLPVETLDAAIISHAHLDHSGFVPHLYTFSQVKWYATPPTRDICEVLFADSMKIMGDELPYRLPHYKKAFKHWQPMLYQKPVHLGNTIFQAHDAGHIAGSAMIDINYQGKRVLYTGDFKMETTRMHAGAKPVEDVHTLIIDSTYARREHPERKSLEGQLIDEVEETLENDGHVLLPAFAVGRTQELIRLIRSYNSHVPVFVDGMGRTIAQIYLRNKQYIRDGMQFKKELRSVRMIEHPSMRKKVTHSPCVIITSAGMMEGGPVLGYLTNLNPNSKIILTGYAVEGTNAWKLLNKGYVTINEFDLEVGLPVEYLDLSAHAGKSDIMNFIQHANPEKIVIVHSDAAKEFEAELRGQGFDAVAPAPGDKIEC